MFITAIDKCDKRNMYDQNPKPSRAQPFGCALDGFAGPFE
jgi:hypothetical protein